MSELRNIFKKESVITVLLLVFFLSLHFILALSSFYRKSPTFDEPVHLTGGISYWRNNDYRINPENGMFPQRWAALPLISDRNVNLPSSDTESWLDLNEWVYSYNFLYKTGNDPDSMFIRARFMMLLLSLILGVSIYFISRKLFGATGALLTVFLYSLSPTVLAHARLVASDMAVTVAFILSVWAIWNMLHGISIKTVLFSSLALSILFLSKMSAVFIVPVFMIMLAIRLVSKKPLNLKVLRKALLIEKQGRQLCVFIVAGLINTVFILFFIWAAFGFRYSMLNDENTGREILDSRWESISKSAGNVGDIVNIARDHKIMPEAYLFGFMHVYRQTRKHYAFLNGERSLTGWWYFFPYCCLVKTPLPLFFLLALGALAAFMKYRKAGSARADDIRKNIYNLSPYLALAGIVVLFSVTSNMNIGQRHVLVLYPLAFISAGALSYYFIEKHRYLRITVLFFLLWFIIESCSIWPDYLAYFNQLAGGPSRGYRHLVDSSLDWGQDLKSLKKWIERNNPDKADNNVYLSYFGTACLSYYRINAERLPCYFEQKVGGAFPLDAGIYCISATMLQMPYFQENLAWSNPGEISIDEKLFRELDTGMQELFNAAKKPGKLFEFLNKKGLDYWEKQYRLYEILRFGKLCKYLQKRDPVDNAGYSILIYRLEKEDISEAMKIDINELGE